MAIADEATRTTEDVRLLGEVVTDVMDRLRVPGIAVGIQDGEREILAGFGVTSVTNPLPVDGDTIFQVGSTTKTVTATVVMRLVERQLIDLDAPIRTYLPNLKLSSESVASAVTMRHLLTHTGGWQGDYFGNHGRGDDALQRIVETLVDLPQLTPLGEEFAYNNAGFYLAGRVIEVVTGQVYEDVARELLLEPLGMTMSFFQPEEVMTYRFAVGHGIENDQVAVLRPWELSRTANAVGGLASTARDQLRYARFHLGNGTGPDGSRLLSPESIKEMQRDQAPARSMAEAMGLPWRINHVGGARVVAHGGGTMAQASAFEMIPERNFAITILTNTKGRGSLDEILAWAYHHFLGLRNPEREPLDLPADQLAEYAGTYVGKGADVELTADKGRLVMYTIPKGGFPTPDVPPPPAPPPATLAFFSEDRVFVEGSSPVSGWGEFLRDEAGEITWFHLGGRISRRSRA